MKKINWSLYSGGRHLDSGSVLAEDEREVIGRVLSRDLGGEIELKEDGLYTVRAGDALASSYGDEFRRTGGAIGDAKLMPGEAPAEELSPRADGYLFKDPRPNPCRDSGCVHDWNADWVWEGEVYPRCRKCGLTGSIPARKATPEEKGSGAMERARSSIQRMIEETKWAGGLSPEMIRVIANGRVGKPGCPRPEDHLLRSWFDTTARVHHYGCARCKRGYVLSDEQQQNLPYGFDLDGMIRGILSQ